jgi:hypothetical protein
VSGRYIGYITSNATYEGPKGIVFPENAERKVEIYVEQTDWVVAHRNLSISAKVKVLNLSL